MLALLLISLLSVVAAMAAPALEVDPEAKGQIWAVLVAGSNTWSNYRHQADVCHAYQILHRHGVPDSNIIVMMYDDIANNDENPTKGVIINKPNGPNVYGPKEVPKDYTGDDVTPDNFINILTGNKKAMQGKGSGKVLESGPNDHVFVNFVDHGSTGMLLFPNDVLKTSNLINALKTMHGKNMYKKLVFYVEACESGSMFNNLLPSNTEILAVTAANPHEPSWVCYWDHKLQTFLGDVFSVAWMEDIDSEEAHKTLTSETLLEQYKKVFKRTTKRKNHHSHPKIYGETSVDADKVIDYVGAGTKSIQDSNLEDIDDAVSSRNVSLHILEKKIENTKEENEKSELIKKRHNLIKGRQAVDEIFSLIIERLNEVDPKEIVESHQPLTPEVLPCYETVVDYFRRNCVNINKNTYALAHLYKLANLCVEKVSADDIITAISEECTEYYRAMSGVN